MKTARIHIAPTGRIHTTSDALPYLDESGWGHSTVAAAYRAAAEAGYTHAIVSVGKGRDLHRIPSRYR